MIVKKIQMNLSGKTIQNHYKEIDSFLDGGFLIQNLRIIILDQ